MSDNGYPTVALRRIEGGYETHGGEYRVIRDYFSDIGSSRNGCYRACFHVYRVSKGTETEVVHRFCETLREARIEIVCDMEKRQASQPPRS